LRRTSALGFECEYFGLLSGNDIEWNEPNESVLNAVTAWNIGQSFADTKLAVRSAPKNHGVAKLPDGPIAFTALGRTEIFADFINSTAVERAGLFRSRCTPEP